MSNRASGIGRKTHKYVWETYILDAGEPLASVATSYVPPHLGNPAVVGAAGKTVSIEPDYRSMMIFFKSDTVGGGYMTIDGVRYNADMGGSRGDPILAYTITDEDSTFVAEPVIEAFDGAIVEVQVQIEVV